MTFPKSAIKVKCTVVQFREVPPPCPKWLEYSSHSLAYEISPLSRKLTNPYSVPLSPSEMAHTVCGVCFFLNKSTFYLSLLSLTELFLLQDIKNFSFIKPDTRCVISVKRQQTQIPIKVTVSLLLIYQ